jgi:hypothetical protein
MALGYETFEDNREFEQKGLTGEVARYSTENMVFPCYIVCSTQENPVDINRVKILKGMAINSGKFDEEMLLSTINIYYNQSNKTIRLGKIFPKQVKSFLSLFKGNIIEGYYDKDTKLTDEYLYVLSE